MFKRKAIAISIAFHAVLLTALVLYWVMQRPPQQTVEEEKIFVATIESWKPPPPPKPEPPKPTPPIHEPEKIYESSVEKTSFVPHPEPRNFSGPVTEDALREPPSPQPISRISPVYPSECRDDTGTVQATLTVAPNGDVIDVEIVSATKNCFAREARKALKRWHYASQLVTEVSTGSERKVNVEIVFDLKD